MRLRHSPTLSARVQEVVTSCGRFHCAIFIMEGMMVVHSHSGGQAPHHRYDGSFLPT
jgi:hypothetical protein